MGRLKTRFGDWGDQRGQALTDWASVRGWRVALVVTVMLVSLAAPAYAAAYVFTIPGDNGSAPPVTVPRWQLFTLIYAGLVMYVFHQVIQAIVMAVIKAWRER